MICLWILDSFCSNPRSQPDTVHCTEYSTGTSASTSSVLAFSSRKGVSARSRHRPTCEDEDEDGDDKQRDDTSFYGRSRFVPRGEAQCKDRRRDL